MSIEQQEPFIPASQSLPEITIKGTILAIILTIVLGAANSFLSLRVGITVAASIPAAVISMGALRFFKRTNILENNIVQTAASMGEAMTAGLSFILPALIILHFWTGFHYWETVIISLLAGCLGVLFSIPLRRVLINDKTLRFPEGTAIGQVLKVSASSTSTDLKYLVSGGVIGGLIELCQSGFGLLASECSLWTSRFGGVFGFGWGYSPALFAAGYIVGVNVAISILVGVVLGWAIGVPLLSYAYGIPDAQNLGAALWSAHLRYVGVGTMLIGGLWTVLTLMRQIYRGVKASVVAVKQRDRTLIVPRTERDIPITVAFWLLLGVLVLIFIFLFHIIDPKILHTGTLVVFGVSLLGTVYVLTMGFVLCSVAGYFAGLVGSTNCPGSGLIVSGLLIFSLLLLALFKAVGLSFTPDNMMAMASVSIIVLTIMASGLIVASDTIQDLKAGQIVGATPWKQQVMLVLGCVVASFVLPLVLQLLFNAYGIGGVFPRPGMDPTKMLAAPQAGLMAAVAQGVFTQNLPWAMIIAGAIVAVFTIMVDEYVKRVHGTRLPVLAVGLGIYLPLSASTPLIMGGLLSYFLHRFVIGRKQQHKITPEQVTKAEHSGLLLACGIVAGASVMGVVLAIPFAIAKSSTVLQFVPSSYVWLPNILSVLGVIGLCYVFYRVMMKAVTSAKRGA